MVDSIDRDDGPTLWSLHLALPHQPWERWPDGTRYATPAALGTDLPDVDADELRYSWSASAASVSEQRHLLQAEYADRLVGQVLDRLETEGLYDRSLVVVVSDHGVSFEPGTPAREVERSTVDAIAYTPLIVKAPGQRSGQIDDSNIGIIDVTPTIADVLGLSLSWDADGAPAGSAEIRARGAAKAIHDLGPFLGLREEVRFDDGDAFATVGERWIRGPRGSGRSAVGPPLHGRCQPAHRSHAPGDADRPPWPRSTDSTHFGHRAPASPTSRVATGVVPDADHGFDRCARGGWRDRRRIPTLDRQPREPGVASR